MFNPQQLELNSLDDEVRFAPIPQIQCDNYTQAGEKGCLLEATVAVNHYKGWRMSDRKADIKLFRDNPWAISAYLSEEFAKNDFDLILAAINRVMRAQNVQALAREGGLRRDRLYKTFGGEIDPTFGRVMALFDALGVALTVRALPPRETPPRPRLGRPRKHAPKKVK